MEPVASRLQGRPQAPPAMHHRNARGKGETKIRNWGGGQSLNKPISLPQTHLQPNSVDRGGSEMEVDPHLNEQAAVKIAPGSSFALVAMTSLTASY